MIKLLILPILSSFAVELTPGQYEVTTDLQTPIPQAQNMNRKHVDKTCIEKPQDAKKMMEDALKGSDCKISDFKDSGKSANWTMKCNVQGAEMVGGGKMTASGDKFTGDSHMTLKVAGMEMKSTAQHSGKRIGPCPPTTKK